MTLGWLVGWCVLAWAGGDAEHQALAELEWSRAEPVQLLAQLPGADEAARLRLVRGLGRLRDPDTASDLLVFRDDPSPAVQRMAATALGWVPGAAPQLRVWLDEVPPATSSLGRADPQAALRALLVRGLGHQGTARDLDTLRRALGEPWPTGAAAAHALGRLALRGTPGAEEAVSDLVHRLRAADSRVSEAAAFALGRVGLEGASELHVQRVAEEVTGGATPEARAWALKACWPQLQPDQRVDVFLAAATSTSRLVKATAFERVGPGDIDGVVLAAWLADPDPWVRAAAVAALGRVGSRDDSLVELANGDDVWLASSAIEALGWGDLEVVVDAEAPVPVRAAHALGLDEVEVLLELVAKAPAPVQSAAAVRLLELEPAGDAAVDALHGSDDPVVRELAVELRAVGAGAVVRDLLRWATSEEDPDVQSAIAEALVGLHEANRRALRGSDPSRLIERLAQHPLPRPRAAARALAEAAGKPAPERVALRFPTQFGDGLERDEGWPDLAAISSVRGAVVHTDHGELSLQLDPDTAPLAVYAFATLAEASFYDGLLLHRVVPGFVVQGGDPRGDGWGDPGWSLPDEVSALPFDEGALGMARSGPDTGGSQWFITTSDQPHLVGAYTRFGKVSGGLHAVRRMPRGTIIEGITIERVEPR